MVNRQVFVRFGWLIDPAENLSRSIVFFSFPVPALPDYQ